MANSHATKNPFRPTSAAMITSFPNRTAGGSHCWTMASAIAKPLNPEDKRRFMDRIQLPASESPPESLPAGFGYARDEPLRRQLAEGEARNLKPPNESAAPAGHL